MGEEVTEYQYYWAKHGLVEVVRWGCPVLEYNQEAADVLVKRYEEQNGRSN